MTYSIRNIRRLMVSLAADGDGVGPRGVRCEVRLLPHSGDWRALQEAVKRSVDTWRTSRCRGPLRSPVAKGLKSFRLIIRPQVVRAQVFGPQVVGSQVFGPQVFRPQVFRPQVFRPRVSSEER